MSVCPRCAPRSAAPAVEPAAAPAPVAAVALAPAPVVVSAPVAAPTPVYQQPAPQPIQYQTPPVAPQPIYSAYAAPEPDVKAGMNPILVIAIVAVGLLGLGYAAYTYLLPSSRASQESPAAAAKSTLLDANGEKTNPLSKYIEVTGFRMREDKNQKVTVQMVIVNHGGADIAGLEMQVGLYAKGHLVVEFPVKVKSLGPYEVAQGTGTATTKLRAYEIPDWQFLTPKFVVTAP